MSSKNDVQDEPIIARDATYYRAPEAFKERLRTALAQEARAQQRDAQWWRWGGIAASFAIACLLTWNGVLLQSGGTPEDRLAAEVITAHVRSLMAEGHLNDVASSDRHTVKPWFQGKLDFAPNVVDLAESGYALAGGRLDYVNGRAVAALTYRHRLHVVNLFEWPAPGAADRAAELTLRRGYALVHWRRGGLEYWAVSDSAPEEVMELAKRYPG